MQYYKSNITVYNIIVTKTKTVFNCFKGMGFVLYSYKCLSLSFESSFELQMGNPKWRYKDLENRRHVGLGQEASSGLSKNWRYADLNNAETRGSQKKRRERHPHKQRTRERGPWKLRCGGTKDFAYASAIMPDTRTQAEGTPCSLKLQLNCVKRDCNIYMWENSEQILNDYRSIWPERGWHCTLPTQSISGHVTGLLNNRCLL